MRQVGVILGLVRLKKLFSGFATRTTKNPFPPLVSGRQLWDSEVGAMSGWRDVRSGAPLGQNSEFRYGQGGRVDSKRPRGAMWMVLYSCIPNDAFDGGRRGAGFLPKNPQARESENGSAAGSDASRAYKNFLQIASSQLCRWQAGGGACPDKVGGGIADGASCFWGESPSSPVRHPLHRAGRGACGSCGSCGCVGVWRKPRHEPAKAHPLLHGSARAADGRMVCLGVRVMGDARSAAPVRAPLRSLTGRGNASCCASLPGEPLLHSSLLEADQKSCSFRHRRNAVA